MAIIDGEALAEHLAIHDLEDSVALDLAASAACQAIAEWCSRTFDATPSDAPTVRVFRPDDQCYVKVDDFWTTTGLVVKTDNNDDGTFETTWTINTDFILQPDNGLLHGQTWPYHALVAVSSRLFPTWSRRPAVQVTAAWGWAESPPAVQQAALIWGARLYKRRRSPEGILGGFADFGIARVGRGDPDVHAVTGLLAPFVHPSRAALIA